MSLGHASPPALVEFFAGRCKIARLAHKRGWRAVAVDILYDAALPASTRDRIDKRSPFDLNSAAGLASLCLHLYTSSPHVCKIMAPNLL